MTNRISSVRERDTTLMQIAFGLAGVRRNPLCASDRHAAPESQIRLRVTIKSNSFAISDTSPATSFRSGPTKAVGAVWGAFSSHTLVPFSRSDAELDRYFCKFDANWSPFSWLPPRLRWRHHVRDAEADRAPDGKKSPGLIDGRPTQVSSGTSVQCTTKPLVALPECCYFRSRQREK